MLFICENDADRKLRSVRCYCGVCGLFTPPDPVLPVTSRTVRPRGIADMAAYSLGRLSGSVHCASPEDMGRARGQPEHFPPPPPPQAPPDLDLQPAASCRGEGGGSPVFGIRVIMTRAFTTDRDTSRDGKSQLTIAQFVKKKD